MINSFEDSFLYHRIHKLIQRKSAGTAEQLGSKLGKDKRTAQRYVSNMKDMGFPIKLCPWRKTYYYTAEVEFDIRFKVFGKDEIDDPDKIKGGHGSTSQFDDFLSHHKKKF